MSTVPSDWLQLREAARTRLDEDLRELAFEAKLARRVLDREAPTLTSAFNGSPEYLARVFVVSGLDRAREVCYLADEAVPRLLVFGDEPAKTAPASAVEALSYIALMRCLGMKLPDSADDVEQRWLRIIAPGPDLLNEFGIRTAALASVAAREEALVPDLVGGGPLAPRSTSRDIAGPNIPGLARHLGEVLLGNGGVDAVEGPWWSFLRAFPLTLASDGVRWIDLVLAAFIMMVRFEGRTAAEVGTWLPKLVGDL